MSRESLLGKITDTASRTRRAIHHGTAKLTDVEFVDEQLDRGINTFVIVADSAWQSVDQYLMDLEVDGKVNRWGMPSERSIPAVATGKWFATGELSNMMMQNSGFSNAMEYLRTIMQVHKIPGVLTSGWRGFEFEGSPPHDLLGDITDKDNKNVYEKIDLFGTRSGRGLYTEVRKALDRASEGNYGHLVCIRLSPGGLEKTYELRKVEESEVSYHNPAYYEAVKAKKGRPFEEVQAAGRMHPDDAMRFIVSSNPSDAFYFVYNGYGARRFQALNLTENCFENAGGMGSSTALAWGAAKSNPEQLFIAIDGDQNTLMNDSMDDVLSSDYPPNMKRYIVNNGAGDSVGRALSRPLAPWKYDLSYTINIENQDPNEPFPYPRVGARGLKFNTQEALDLAKEIGDLPAVAWLGRKRLIELKKERDNKKREEEWDVRQILQTSKLPHSLI